MATPKPPKRTGAFFVAAGIMASRIFGLLRERALAHYFGVSAHADVFTTALRAPNIIQIMLGEQTLSAAFIPIYTKLLADNRPRDAGRFAGAIFGLLVLLAGALSVAGFLLASPIVAFFSPGYLGDAELVASGQLEVDRFALAVRAVRYIFPMTGLLVLSAWALGILNSHRRFFIPYFAPVLWNTAIIAAVLGAGMRMVETDTLFAQDGILFAACAGALLGGALQFGVQLPFVFRELQGFVPSISLKVEGVRRAIRSFGPVVAGRGVVQVSNYLEILMASLLAPGAQAALGWAQRLYGLPISLFGMSVAAAELPELSSRDARQEADVVVKRLRRALASMNALTLLSVVGFLAFGYLAAALVFRTGAFDQNGNMLVYVVLATYSIGLAASASSRLMQNAFYALQDTKTPAKVAFWRVLVSVGIGASLMFEFDTIAVREILGTPATSQGMDLRLGVVGLAIGTSVSAWLELGLLLHKLRRVLGAGVFPWARVVKLFGVCILASAPAAAVWWLWPPMHIALTAVAVWTTYGAAYVAIGKLLGVTEISTVFDGVMRRLRKSA